MASIPFAFSVHHFVSSVGADAGFAAIIGLAILVFLYFAQARETRTLRDQAAESDAHLQELELRLAQLSRSGTAAGSGTMPPAPAPAPRGIARPAAAIAAARVGAAAPVASRTASPVAAPQGLPVAPAGVGAPALSSATRLIPISETDPVPAHSNGGPAVYSPSGPRPATAAGGANGASSVGAGGSGGSTVTPAPAPAPRPAARPPAGRAAPPPRRPAGTRPPGSGGGSRISRGFIILLTLLAVVAVVVVLLILTSGGGSSNTASSSSSQSSSAASHRARARHAVTVVTPASVTVAVLNGTSTANLAHNVASQLGAAGFKEGAIATAADQTETATVVGYLPGHKAAALLVAKSLKLGSASVQPVDQSNRTVACPASTPCSAKVVVTVGSDLASTQ